MMAVFLLISSTRPVSRAAAIDSRLHDLAFDVRQIGLITIIKEEGLG